MKPHDRKDLTTKDSDNDMDPYSNKANKYIVAWWYNTCHKVNLNGLYREDNYTEYGMCINLSDWK